MSIVLSVLFLRMFIYVNTLYYSLILLVIVISLLYLLVSNLILHSLTILIMAIVYIGAMMILIGYTCAICPNLILSPTPLNWILFLCLILSPTLLFPIKLSPVFNTTFIPIVAYFYSYSGLLVFLTLIFILFITLLIVTSQYMTPKGPFRAVTI